MNGAAGTCCNQVNFVRKIIFCMMFYCYNMLNLNNLRNYVNSKQSKVQ